MRIRASANAAVRLLVAIASLTLLPLATLSGCSFLVDFSEPSASDEDGGTDPVDAPPTFLPTRCDVFEPAAGDDILQNDTQPLLTPETNLEGSICQGTDRDYFRFSSENGGAVTVTLTYTGDTQLGVRIHDRELGVVDTSVFEALGADDNLTATATAEQIDGSLQYVIEVFPEGGTGAADYTLNVTCACDPAPEVLAP
ncbi:MAG: hypothetical protein AAGC55_20875 [Myxococcota bacterium]